MAFLSDEAGTRGEYHSKNFCAFVAEHAEVRKGFCQAAREAGFSAMPAANVEEALRWIARHADRHHPPVVLIMGSLYLAGEVLKANGESPD